MRMSVRVRVRVLSRRWCARWVRRDLRNQKGSHSPRARRAHSRGPAACATEQNGQACACHICHIHDGSGKGQVPHGPGVCKTNNRVRALGLCTVHGHGHTQTHTHSSIKNDVRRKLGECTSRERARARSHIKLLVSHVRTERRTYAPDDVLSPFAVRRSPFAVRVFVVVAAAATFMHFERGRSRSSIVHAHAPRTRNSRKYK